MRNVYAVLVTIIAIVSLIGNFFLYMRYSSSRPLITVNDQVIRRKDLDDRLDFFYSNNLLRQMIYSDLVMQAARKEGVVPTDAAVNSEIDQLHRTSPEVLSQNQKLDPSLYYFKQDIRANLALDNLRVKGVQLSDQDIESYYQAHQKQFALPQQSEAILVLAPNSVDAQTAQRLLTNGVKPAVIAETRGLRVLGMNAALTGQFPLAISEQLMAIKPGEIKTLPVGRGEYLIAKVASVAPAEVPSLEQIRPQVELQAKLAKAPTQQQVLAKLRDQARIVVNTGKYAPAVPPTHDQQVASAGQ